jgi:hypothetical protein
MHKALGIRRQEALRVPGRYSPPPDRYPAMNQRYGTNRLRWNRYDRWNHRNPVSRARQRDYRVRCAAFEDDVRSDMGDVAGGFEPPSRGETAPQNQQGMVGKLAHLEHRAMRQAMRLRQHREHVHGVEGAAAKPLAPGRHDGYVYLAFG